MPKNALILEKAIKLFSALGAQPLNPRWLSATQTEPRLVTSIFCCNFFRACFSRL